MDLSETGGDLILTAELPGIEKEDLEITISENRVTIRGEKKKEQETEEGGYYRMERSYGAFDRSLVLPCDVESDRMEATFKNGLLKLKMLHFSKPWMTKRNC